MMDGIENMETKYCAWCKIRPAREKAFVVGTCKECQDKWFEGMKYERGSN